MATPSWAAGSTAAPGEDDRWSSRLPLDLERAGPEIYNRCRGSGASSMREWLQQNYQGEKNSRNSVWLGAWNGATEVDFAVAACPNLSAVMAMLSVNDFCEINLRRIASE